MLIRAWRSDMVASSSHTPASCSCAERIRAARSIDEGERFADPPARLVEENLWRAIRHGMDAEFIDLESHELVPARRALEQTAAWAGVDLALPERSPAQRQRDLLASGASLREVYASIVSETRRTYGRAAPIA